MRLVEIKISCHKKEDELIAGENNVDDVPARCDIDLDKVATYWEDPVNKEVLIYMDNGVSYWTDSYTFDEFRIAMVVSGKGASLAKERPIVFNKPMDSSGSPETVTTCGTGPATFLAICPDCSQVLQNGKCTACGRVVTKNKE
jgi:hypothetical protein